MVELKDVSTKREVDTELSEVTYTTTFTCESIISTELACDTVSLEEMAKAGLKDINTQLYRDVDYLLELALNCNKAQMKEHILSARMLLTQVG